MNAAAPVFWMVTDCVSEDTVVTTTGDAKVMLVGETTRFGSVDAPVVPGCCTVWPSTRTDVPSTLTVVASEEGTTVEAYATEMRQTDCGASIAGQPSVNWKGRPGDRVTAVWAWAASLAFDI